MKKRTLGPQIVFGQESHPPAARAGVALNKSGRLDLNQRPPAPEAGQYSNQLLHSAGL
jgi:hypothetical protein